MESFAEIGAFLKEEREKRRLKIDDIAKSLKIRAVYLEAIEDGRFRDLPGPIYSFGYLKIYYDLLALEDKEILQTFKNLMEVEFFSGSAGPQGDPYNHELKPKPEIIVISLLLLVLIYFFWYYAIYFPGKFDKHKYSVLKEKILIEKAKELYGTTEEQ